VGEFNLGKEAVLDPDKYLSERVVQSYNTGADSAQDDSGEE
jgi:hypothetical protein